MGLLGCPASFQRLMETVLRNISNVLVYIDDVLLHTATHEEHLKVLEKVFERLHQNHLKVNLDKCVFGNKIQSIWGSCKIFNRKMIDLLDHFAEDSNKRLFMFVTLTK